MLSGEELVRRFMEEFDAEEILEDDRRRRGQGLMPQPNMQQMLKQAQKMQQDMLAAQEALKDEVVEASAGGGMVTVKVSGDLCVKSITIDPEAVDPEDVEMLQDMVLAAINEALRSAQELASAKLGGITGGLRRLGASATSGSPRLLAGRPLSVYAPPVQRLITELSKLPGVGGRTAQRLAFHLLRASDEEALALAARSARSRSGSACARRASTSPTARAAGSAPTSAAIPR